MKLSRYADAETAAKACAESILAHLNEAIGERGAAYFAISGGASPKPMFERFAHTSFPWDRVQLYWVDERVVPPTDSQSNYKFAADSWLHPGRFPVANIHRVLTELGPEIAAQTYAQEVRANVPFNASLPVFDVVHRGMGPDGHTASLFPGEPLIADRGGIAAAVWVEKMGHKLIQQSRVTLLPGVLEAARHTELLVTGADKAQVLKAVLSASYDSTRYPVQIGSLTDSAEWFVDAAAKPD